MSFSPLAAGRFLLRPPEADDARELARVFGAARVAHAAGRIARARARLLAGDGFAFLVRGRAGGPPFGLAELALDARGGASGALSWRPAAGRRDSGAARAAARCLAAFGFDTLGLSRIHGAARRPGAASGRARILHVAAAALVDDRGRVLLARRPPGKAMAGLWEFPGGKVEPGERPRDTLAREMFEELGLEIPAAAFEPWDIVCHDYDDFRLLMPLMRCPAPPAAPCPREGQAVRWTPPERLRDFPMPPADKPLVERLVSAAGEISPSPPWGARGKNRGGELLRFRGRGSSRSG